MVALINFYSETIFLVIYEIYINQTQRKNISLKLKIILDKLNDKI